MESEKLFDYLKNLKLSRILDFGCGELGSHLDIPGYPALCEAYPQAAIEGYEPDFTGFKKKPYEKCWDGPLPLSLQPGSFDLIAAMDVLEHIGELDQALREVRRLLAPGGYFLTSVPEGGSVGEFLYRQYSALRSGSCNHLHRFSKEEWMNGIYDATGFALRGTIEKVNNYGWLPSPRLASLFSALSRRALAAPTGKKLREKFIYGYLFVWQAP
jgi:SAM-dependent methyltransferase